MAIPRGQRALRACRSVLLLCCLRSPALLWAAPPCTAELGPGGEVQGALDARRPGPVARGLGAGEFPVHRFVSNDRDDVVLRGQGATTVIRADRALESPVIVVGDHRRQVPEHVVAKVRIESLRVVGGGWHAREYHPDRPYPINSAIAVRAGQHVVIRDGELARWRSGR